MATDLILLNGAGYARWVNKVSLPASRLVNTSRDFTDPSIETASGVSHGPGGEHSHSGIAFTTWLDLDLAARQAEAVAKAITRKQPDAKDRVAKNLEALQGELRALDASLKRISATAPSRPLLASHPVYQYLARRYSLNIESVLWEPDEVPTQQRWRELEDMLSEHPARWMIWEGEPLPETAARLRALGVESILFDPCANRPDAGDFISVMSDNPKNLEMVYRERPSVRRRPGPAVASSEGATVHPARLSGRTRAARRRRHSVYAYSGNTLCSVRLLAAGFSTPRSWFIARPSASCRFTVRFRTRLASLR